MGQPDHQHRPSSPPSSPQPRPPRPDPATARALSRNALFLGVLLIALYWISISRFPANLLGIVVGIATIIIGLRGVLMARRAKASKLMIGAHLITVGMASVTVLSLVALAILWPLSLQYQECLDGAITVFGFDECTAERESASQDFIRDKPSKP